MGAIAPLVAGRGPRERGRAAAAAPAVDASPGLATALVRALDEAGVLVDNIEVRQPSLDDVFFTLTGGHIEEDETDEDGHDGGGAGGDGDGAGPVVPSAGDGRHELEGARA